MALALALRTALAPVLEGSASYLFYVPAILVASALGGWGPGVFATFLGLLAGLFFVADYRALTAAEPLGPRLGFCFPSAKCRVLDVF